MTKVLYMPSTPLNLLVSVALANSRRETDQAELWLIDQKNTDDNPYFQALKNWTESPFKQVKILAGKATGIAKLAEREANFSVIDQGLKLFQPDIIAVGSDRRVEFQYAMHQLRKHQSSAQGWYLDDGLYSYAGRPYHPIKDGVNRWIKKITYGLWWDEPKTVGASNWINQAWLFNPTHAYKGLASKPIKKLQSDWFSNPEVQVFSQWVIEQFDLKVQKLESVDVVLIIPHPNNQLKMKDYVQRIHKFVEQLLDQGKRIALKYHPRQQGDDALGLAKSERVVIIPAGLAFEFVLPMLKVGTQVYGDVGTVLLTAKWLRDDVQPMALINRQDPFQLGFLEMFIQNEIPVLEEDAVLTMSNVDGEVVE